MTSDCRPPRWPAWLLLTAMAGAIGVAVLALVLYPANLRDPAAPTYLTALAAVLVCYIGLIVWELRRPAGGRVLGAVFGLAAAAVWSVEVWAGGPAKLDRSTERTVGAVFAVLAVALTVAAGILAGLRSRNPRVAVHSGLFAGLVSGATLFCFAVVMTLTSLGVLASRADYRQEYAARSRPGDIATYLVGDILAAGVAHLVINLVLGLVGGALGAIVAATVGLGRVRGRSNDLGRSGTGHARRP